MTSGDPYYIRYVDANTIELASASGGSAINFSAVGQGLAHQLRVYADGTNTQFKVRTDSTDISTEIGKLQQKNSYL